MAHLAGWVVFAMVLGTSLGFLNPRTPLVSKHDPRLGTRTCSWLPCGPQYRAHPTRRSAVGLLGLRQQGDYSVTLKTPLGIVFEEVEPGESKGVEVASLVDGGNADLDGRILVGDKLVSVSAVTMDKSNKPLIALGAAVPTSPWGWRSECVGL